MRKEVDPMSVRQYWWGVIRRNPNKTVKEEPLEKTLKKADSWTFRQFEPENFAELYHFPGPEWDQFTGGHNTLLEAVNKIADENLYEKKEDTPKIGKIHKLKEEIPFDDEMDKIILEKRNGKLYAVDGNHRAAALILHHLETGDDVTIKAFVGDVNESPKLISSIVNHISQRSQIATRVLQK